MPDQQPAVGQEEVVHARVAPGVRGVVPVAAHVEEDARVGVAHEAHAGHVGQLVRGQGHPAVLNQEELAGRDAADQGLGVGEVEVEGRAVHRGTPVPADVGVAPHLHRRQVDLGLGAAEDVRLEPAQVPATPGAQRRRQQPRHAVGHDGVGDRRVVEADVGDQVGARVHEVPEAHRRQAGRGVVDVGQAQGVSELVVERPGDAAQPAVLGGGLGDDRAFAQQARLARVLIDGRQRDRLPQGDEEGGDVVGRIQVDVALPVRAGMDEDHVGQGIVVVVVGQLRPRGIRGGLHVRQRDDVAHQGLEAVDGPPAVGARRVVGQVAQLVAVGVAGRQHLAVDGQSSVRLDAVVFGQAAQVGLEVGLVVGRRIDDVLVGGRLELEIAVDGDAGQIAAAVGLEADAHQQHPQRRLILLQRGARVATGGSEPRRGEPFARQARHVPLPEQLVDAVVVVVQHVDAPLFARSPRLAVGTGVETLGGDLHHRHLLVRPPLRRAGLGGREPQRRQDERGDGDTAQSAGV